MELKDTNPFLKYGIITLVACLVLQLLWLIFIYLIIPLAKWFWTCLIVGGWNLICDCVSGILHFICTCVIGIWNFILNGFDFVFLDVFHQGSFLATVAAIAWRSIIIGVILLVVKTRHK